MTALMTLEIAKWCLMIEYHQNTQPVCMLRELDISLVRSHETKLADMDRATDHKAGKNTIINTRYKTTCIWLVQVDMPKSVSVANYSKEHRL